MKKTTFDASIRMGQMIRLLSVSAQHDKPFRKALSHLLSRLESMVFQATIATELGQDAERVILIAEDALAQNLMDHLDLPKMVGGAKGMGTIVWKKRPKTMPFNQKKVNLLASAKTAMNAAATLNSVPEMRDRRATLLHTYASLVRNSLWVPTLLRLKIDPTVASIEGSTLLARYSTEMGRQRLMSNTATFVSTDENTLTATTPSVAPMEGMFTTLVQMTMQALVTHPKVATLIAVSHPDATQGKADAKALAQLLDKASQPVVVPPGQDPAVVAQGVLDRLIQALEERKKTLAAALKKHRAQQVANEEERALAGLKNLDPAVIKLLKKKPDLLKNL